MVQHVVEPVHNMLLVKLVDLDIPSRELVVGNRPDDLLVVKQLLVVEMVRSQRMVVQMVMVYRLVFFYEIFYYKSWMNQIKR